MLESDFEYQHKVQRSVSGYQLLGGTTVPDLDQFILPRCWVNNRGRSRTRSTCSTPSARLDYAFMPMWRLCRGGQLQPFADRRQRGVCLRAALRTRRATFWADPSRSISLRPTGRTTSTTIATPANCASMRRRRRLLLGHMKTGPVTHELAGGGELFRRNVEQPGFSAGRCARYGAGWRCVMPIGFGEYLSAERRFPIEDPIQSAGPRRLSGRSSISARHRAGPDSPSRAIQLLAAGGYDSLRDHNYSDGCEHGQARVAAAVCGHVQSRSSTLTLYGNYGVLLSLGPQAPWWAAMAASFWRRSYTRQSRNRREV